MSLPFTYLLRAASLEPVYLVRFKLQKLIQLKLGPEIGIHNQVFPAPKVSEYIGQLCELELSTLEQTAKAFSRIRTLKKFYRQRAGSHRVSGTEKLMTGVLKFL